MTLTTSFPSVDDLRRALRAASTDKARVHPGSGATVGPWEPAPGERVVLVFGCGGSAGTTTMAMAVATVAGRARVVETCPALASGLAYAATAELGATERGWLRGTRDEAVVERRPDSVTSPDLLPAPPPSDVPLTIIDSSWDIAAVRASAGWLGDLARTSSTVVLVTRATVPGLRRLETAIDRLGERRVVAVTMGARRWPRPVEQSAGAAVRRLAAHDRIVHVPVVPAFAISGLTPDPLPPAILRPARTLLTLLEGPPT